MKADAARTLQLLKTARGQIDGVIRMVEDDRYCIDISNQIQAASAILAKVNLEILSANIQGCVKDAMHGQPEDAEAKIEEVLEILDRCL